MKQLRLLAMGVGALAGAGSLVLVACSSDDTIVPVSGNPEAGLTDTGTDVAVITDGGTDADAFVDIDAGFTVDNMQLLIANALCDATSRCCYGAELQEDAGIDGGTHFDRAACITTSKKGFTLSNLGLDSVNASTVTLNQTKAKECVDRLKVLGCSPTPTDFATARQSCFDAVYGKGIAGTACTQTIECGQGLFCNTPDGGAGGTCTAVRQVDGPCGDFTTDEGVADYGCSTRGSGDTARFCRTYSDALEPLDRADWKCAQVGAVGSTCVATSWCGASLCDNADVAASYKCQASDVPLFPPSVCALYSK